MSNGSRVLWGVVSTFGAVLIALGAFVLTTVQSHAERITRLEEALRNQEKAIERIEAAALDINRKVDLLVQRDWKAHR